MIEKEGEWVEEVTGSGEKIEKEEERLEEVAGLGDEEGVGEV